MVVRAAGDWTFVLDPRHELFHEEHPDSTAQQIRFPVRPEQRPFAEALTWWFPGVRLTGATLAMQWGTTTSRWSWRSSPPTSSGSPRERQVPTWAPTRARFLLIRIKDDWFIPGFLDEKGALYEVAKEMVFEFKLVSGSATGIDLRGEDDKIMATARRKG